jgi:hypothetical protein
MYKSMFKMASRHPIRYAQLAALGAVATPMPTTPVAPMRSEVPSPPRRSGAYRALTTSDKAYLANRAERMRNVYFFFAESSTSRLNPDQIGFIASMAATGLLGDDGDAGTRHARKFGQAIQYASAWLRDHQLGPI